MHVFYIMYSGNNVRFTHPRLLTYLLAKYENKADVIT